MPLIFPKTFNQKIILEFLKEFRDILLKPKRFIDAINGYRLLRYPTQDELQLADREIFDSTGMVKKGEKKKEDDSDYAESVDQHAGELLSSNTDRINGLLLSLRMMGSPTATHRSAYILNACEFEAYAALSNRSLTSLNLTLEDFPKDLSLSIDSLGTTLRSFINFIGDLLTHTEGAEEDRLNTFKNFLQGDALWYGIMPILHDVKATGLELPNGMVSGSDRFPQQLDDTIRKREDCTKQAASNCSVAKTLELEDTKSSQTIERIRKVQSERVQKKEAERIQMVAAKNDRKADATEAKDISSEKEDTAEDVFCPTSARKRLDITDACSKGSKPVVPTIHIPAANAPAPSRDTAATESSPSAEAKSANDGRKKNARPFRWWIEAAIGTAQNWKKV